MKATHNIKIDGRWYRAGDELPAEKKVKAEPVMVPETPEAEVPKEEPAKAAEKTAASRRRKTAK